MKNNKNQNIRRFISLAVLIVFGISFISAFSISAPYMENKELKMSPGEIKDLEFVLQNGGATEEINVKVTILDGSDIIRLIDGNDIYPVTPGEKVSVNMKITMPEDAKTSQNYSVKIGFKEVTSEGGSNFGFGTEIEQNFNVVILGKENKINNKLILYLAIGILLILIILVILIIKRKNRKKAK